MKKWIVLTMMVFGCIVSCDDKWKTTDPPDNSLAGSIIVADYENIEQEGMYNEVSIEISNSILAIGKISDTKVQLRYESKWDEVPLYIMIPSIPVSGVPNNVVLDSSFDNIDLKYNNKSYFASGSISGWIKKVIDSKSSHNISLGIPAIPDFTCEININCSVDDKIFNLKITSIKLRKKLYL